MPIDVFLSGLDADQPYIDRLCDALTRRGLEVWSPGRDLKAGDVPDELVPLMVATAEVLAFVVTGSWPQPGQSHPSWDRADEVTRGVVAARSSGKRIFPILLDGVDTDRIPLGLSRVHPLHASREDITATVDGLVSAVDAGGRRSGVEKAAPTPRGWGPDPGAIHVIRLAAPVGDQTRVITEEEVRHACHPARPLDGGLTITLSPPLPGAAPYPFDKWAAEIRHRVRGYLEHRVPASQVNRLAVFGFAPIPLLMTLGRVIGDQHPTILFERHRHTDTWRWDDTAPDDWALSLDRPAAPPTEPPRDVAILVSISDRVKRWAVEAAVAGPLDIYEIRAHAPRVNCVRTRGQLADFARLWREALDAANERSRGMALVHVFAAVPISVAMQMGLGMLPKADPPLIVYDFRHRAFHRALTIEPPP